MCAPTGLSKEWYQSQLDMLSKMLITEKDEMTRLLIKTDIAYYEIMLSRLDED